MAKKSPEKFKEELHNISPNLILLEEYMGCRTPIRVKCLSCGAEFSTLPNSLLTGVGCPDCDRNNVYDITRKKEEDFKVELSVKNPSVLVLGHYENNKAQIRVKCLVCNTEWMGRPCNLLSGHGCPACADERRKESLRISRKNRKRY